MLYVVIFGREYATRSGSVEVQGLGNTDIGEESGLGRPAIETSRLSLASEHVELNGKPCPALAAPPSDFERRARTGLDQTQASLSLRSRCFSFVRKDQR